MATLPCLLNVLWCTLEITLVLHPRFTTHESSNSWSPENRALLTHQQLWVTLLWETERCVCVCGWGGFTFHNTAAEWLAAWEPDCVGCWVGTGPHSTVQLGLLQSRRFNKANEQSTVRSSNKPGNHTIQAGWPKVCGHDLKLGTKT